MRAISYILAIFATWVLSAKAALCASTAALIAATSASNAILLTHPGGVQIHPALGLGLLGSAMAAIIAAAAAALLR